MGKLWALLDIAGMRTQLMGSIQNNDSAKLEKVGMRDEIDDCVFWFY